MVDIDVVCWHCYTDRGDDYRKKGTTLGTYAIAVLAGDGIGPEVTAQGVRVLEAVAERFGHYFKMTEALVGVAAIEAEGDAISHATMRLCQESDAILFGAVGGRSGGRSGGVPRMGPDKAGPSYEGPY